MLGGEAKFMIFVLSLVALAGLAGSHIGLIICYGGWGRRLTHSCGWFKYYIDWPRSIQAGSPCPRCGKTDNDWKYRVGRPITLGIWDWQQSEQK